MAMDFSGEYHIPATRQQVWDALNDPAVLQSSIAGCKRLDKISDEEFTATVATRVGPISATFRGNVVLSDLDAPNGYTLTGQGQGGAAGFARMSAQVALAGDGDHTVLRYVARADIGGKLASVGSRLVQSVARKNADDFFAAFARQLGGSASPEVPVQSASDARPETVTGGSRLLGSLTSSVPAWLVVFGCAIGFALGYMARQLG